MTSSSTVPSKSAEKKAGIRVRFRKLIIVLLALAAVVLSVGAVIASRMTNADSEPAAAYFVACALALGFFQTLLGLYDRFIQGWLSAPPEDISSHDSANER